MSMREILSNRGPFFLFLSLYHASFSFMPKVLELSFSGRRWYDVSKFLPFVMNGKESLVFHDVALFSYFLSMQSFCCFESCLYNTPVRSAMQGDQLDVVNTESHHIYTARIEIDLQKSDVFIPISGWIHISRRYTPPYSHQKTLEIFDVFLWRTS